MRPNTLESAWLWVNHRFGNSDAGQDAQKKGSDEQVAAPPLGLPAQLALLFWAFCWWPESDGALWRALSKEELGQLVSEWLRQGAQHRCGGDLHVQFCIWMQNVCRGLFHQQGLQCAFRLNSLNGNTMNPWAKLLGIYKIKWPGS